MRIAELVVELHGNKEVTINGRNSREGKHGLDEKIFVKQLTAEQQWQILCEARQLLSRLEHAYRQSLVNRGEVSEGDEKRIRSGMGGVPGTKIGSLYKPR
jgi:hypothetical protein